LTVDELYMLRVTDAFCINYNGVPPDWSTYFRIKMRFPTYINPIWQPDTGEYGYGALDDGAVSLRTGEFYPTIIKTAEGDTYTGGTYSVKSAKVWLHASTDMKFSHGDIGGWEGDNLATPTLDAEIYEAFRDHAELGASVTVYGTARTGERVEAYLRHSSVGTNVKPLYLFLQVRYTDSTYGEYVLKRAAGATGDAILTYIIPAGDNGKTFDKVCIGCYAGKGTGDKYYINIIIRSLYVPYEVYSDITNLDRVNPWTGARTHLAQPAFDPIYSVGFPNMRIVGNTVRHYIYYLQKEVLYYTDAVDRAKMIPVVWN